MQQQHDFQFQQVFEGEATVQGDTISAVEFDDTGDYIAIGDKGGSVVILERKKKTKSSKVAYKVLTRFRSHEAEFDYLKSLEIEEKINQIRWLKRRNDSHFLLTTNDKTIKLWKVYEKEVKQISNTNFSSKRMTPSSVSQLNVPKVSNVEKRISHVPRKVYSNAHAYHINSISLNSDGETYISADDLRINLWNLDYSNQSFTIVDIKPENMDDLTEVITSATFHPSQCNIFMYSSSKGTLKLGDLRDSATCRNYSKVFEVEEDPTNRTFFSEIIASVSDAKFSDDGRYILSRDYLTLKVWDVNMEREPIATLNVQEHLRSRLCDLYESDNIFDKFECTFSGDGSHVATGSYRNTCHVFDRTGKNHSTFEASVMQRRSNGLRNGRTGFDPSDCHNRVLYMDWHPSESIIAAASVNDLYIFSS